MADPPVAAVGAPAYLGLFLLSLATLMDEILLTRVFSVTMWYHFAFMAISVAMFGLTAGGLIVYLWPEAFPPPPHACGHGSAGAPCCSRSWSSVAS